MVTVAGTGQIGNDQEGGHLGTDQVICSPWDVVVRKTNISHFFIRFDKLNNKITLSITIKMIFKSYC